MSIEVLELELYTTESKQRLRERRRKRRNAYVNGLLPLLILPNFFYRKAFVVDQIWKLVLEAS